MVEINNGLVKITQVSHEKGNDISGGVLGGEFAYGAYIENDVFKMHPYCWCEQYDCEYCSREEPNFIHKKSGFSVSWYKYIGRGMRVAETISTKEWKVIERECIDSIINGTTLKEELIRKCIFSFGFLPMLLVMEILAKDEEYEWCRIIQKVLNKHSDKYDLEIPKKYSGEAVAQMKINFMLSHGLSGETAESNNPYYADEIIKKI